MKKIVILLVVLSLFLCGCGHRDTPQTGGFDSVEETEITLWTYPVGGWGNQSAVAPFLTSFRSAHPQIRISVRTVDYTTGDNAIENAITTGEAPDLVLEGPERLVANWGARGLMASLDDLWSEEDAASTVYPNVAEACRNGDGVCYIYPLCMTTHCMAINRDLFERADAWKYVDEKTHTWTTDNFIAAVAAVKRYYDENGIRNDVAAVYCGGQGGDQGTRALVNNLYGGTFTDKQHTTYTVASRENIEALQLLKDTDGIRFDPTIVGSQEITAFCNEELAMAFCWNVSQEINQTLINPDIGFDIFPMAFPTNAEKPSLQGGIWGFGIFDNGDPARISAAKEFIRYIIREKYSVAVTTSSYLPVCELERDPYENDDLMAEYAVFRDYLGDYYQITPGWAKARAAWWKLLQRVGNGDDIAEAIENFPDIS